MEEKEIELIRSRLRDLTLHTTCNADFLTFFVENDILSLADVETIAATNEGTARASVFYSIIQTRTNSFPVLLQTLKRFKQVKPLQILNGEGSDEDNEDSTIEIRARVKHLLRDELIKSNIQFDVTPPVHLFTGRSKELEELHNSVMNSKEGKITVISQLTTVSGLGGIGKTQLAREYIKKWGFEFDENVIWLNAESSTSLANSFHRLAVQKLGLSTKNANGAEKSPEGVAEDVYKYFEGSRALFVFDNADDADEKGFEWLQQFFPKPNKNPDIYTIITSRNKEWGIGMKVISLGVFSEEEALSMVKMGLHIDKERKDEDEIILKLAEALQYFPLALYQAISYIYEERQSRNYSIEDYISEFQSTKSQIMLGYRDEDYLDDTYMLTTTTTWKITVDKIGKHPKYGRTALTLLQVFAYLHPDNINREFLTQLPVLLASTSSDEENKRRVIHSARLLVKYSMVDGNDKQRVLNIHRLVQSVTRSQLAPGDEGNTLEIVVRLLEAELNKNRFPSENVDHGITAWRHIWKHPELTHVHSLQVYKIIDKMVTVGRLKEGREICNEALGVLSEVLGEGHRNYDHVKWCLALINRAERNFNESIAIIKELIDKEKERLSKPEHKNESFHIFVLMDFLAGLLDHRDPTSALEMKKEIVKNLEEMFDETHQFTLSAQESIASSFYQKRDFTQTINVHQEVIAKLAIKFGENYSTIIEVLRLKARIGNTFGFQGEWEKAIEIFQEVFNVLTQAPDEYDAEFYAIVANSLGSSLNSLSRYAEALEILQDSAKRALNTLGEKHTKRLQILKSIGIALVGLNKFHEALATHRNVYQGFLNLLGEDNVQTIHAKKEVAVDLSHLGEFSESFSMFAELLEVVKGLGEVEITELQLSFAFAIERSGENLGKALDLLENTKEILRTMFTEDSPRIKNVNENIDRIKTKLLTILKIKFDAGIHSFQNGENETALNIFKEICEELKPVYLEDLQFFVDVSIELGSLLINLKRYSEALNILKISHEKIITVGEQHFEKLVQLLNQISIAFTSMGNFKMALENHKVAANFVNRLEGETSEKALLAKAYVAADLSNLGFHDKAISMLSEILNKIETAGIPEISSAAVYTKMELALAIDRSAKKLQTAVDLLQRLQVSLEASIGNDDLFYTQLSEQIERIKNKIKFQDEYFQMNSADKLSKQGNYKEALAMYKNVFKKIAPIHSEEILLFVNACIGIGFMLNQIGNFDEALTILEENVEKFRQTSSQDLNYLQYFFLENIADSYRGKGALNKALELHEKAYQGIVTPFGEDHRNSLVLKSGIAVDFSHFNKHEESISMFEEILEILQYFGDENDDVIRVRHEYALAIWRSGKDKEKAAEILKGLKEVVKGEIGEENELFQKISESIQQVEKSIP